MVAPAATVVAVVVPSASFAVTATVPAEIVKGPVKVLEPESVRVPEPFLVSEVPAPANPTLIVASKAPVSITLVAASVNVDNVPAEIV